MLSTPRTISKRCYSFFLLAAVVIQIFSGFEYVEMRLRSSTVQTVPNEENKTMEMGNLDPTRRRRREKRTIAETVTAGHIRAAKTEEILRYMQLSTGYRRQLEQKASSNNENYWSMACNDFYEFACRNWLPYQQQQHYQQLWTMDTFSTSSSQHPFVSSLMGLPFVTVRKHFNTQNEMELKVKRQLQVILEESGSLAGAATTTTTTGGGGGGGGGEGTLPIRQDERNLRNFYRSCKMIETNSLLQRKYIHDFVLRNGGLPYISGTRPWQETSYHWLQIIARLRRLYGLNILLDFQIIRNPINQRTNIIIDAPKKLLIPNELCDPNRSLKEKMKKKKGSIGSLSWTTSTSDDYDHDINLIQNYIKDNLRSWFELKEMEAARLAGDIVSFEYEICQYLHGNQRKHQQNMNEEGEDSQEEMAESEVISNSIRWSSMISGLHGSLQSSNYQQQHPQNLLALSKIYDLNLKEYVDTCLDSRIHTQVYIQSDGYLKHLSQLAKIWPMQTFANYIIYKALEEEINIPIKLMTTNNIDQQQQQQQRSMYCIDKCMQLFPQLSGELYQRRYLRNVIKQDVEIVFESIKLAFQRAIQVNWISQNTRRVMNQKLAQLQLSFPEYNRYRSSAMMNNIENLDYWHKLEYLMYYKSNQSLYQQQPQQQQQSQQHSIGINNHINHQLNDNLLEATSVNIELNTPFNNQLQIGWGLLQPPLYSIHYPMSLKFANLGFRLARKLFQMFDVEGWSENPTIHWDELTATNFLNRSKCFQRQLRNYLNSEEFQYYLHYLRPVNDPQQQRLRRRHGEFRELLADNVGLQMAFDGYLNWLTSIDYEPTPTHNQQNILLRQETLANLNFTNTQLFFIHYAQTNCAVNWKGPFPSSSSPSPALGAGSGVKGSKKLHFPQDSHTWERFRLNSPLWNYEEFARDFGCRIGQDMNPPDKCSIYERREGGAAVSSKFVQDL